MVPKRQMYILNKRIKMFEEIKEKARKLLYKNA